MRYVFAPVWLLGFGYGTYQSWVDPGLVLENGVWRQATAADQWHMTALFAGSLAVVAWRIVFGMRIRVAPDALVVSNLVREARIPFDQIRSITQPRVMYSSTVIIDLHTASAFGSRIRFKPAGFGRLAYWKEDHVVTELREQVRAGRTMARRASKRRRQAIAG